MTFCARCGQQIAEGTEACPHCGQPPAITWQSVAAQPAPAPAPYPAYAFAPVGPRGVQGWLLFFCVFLTILMPAVTMVFFGFAAFRGPRFVRGLLQRPELVLGVLRAIFGLVTGVLIWTENRSAMIFLRIYYAWTAAMMLTSVLSWVRILARAHGSFLAAQVISSFGFSLGLVLAGVLYFSLSKRVRNTFGSNLFG